MQALFASIALEALPDVVIISMIAPTRQNHVAGFATRTEIKSHGKSMIELLSVDPWRTESASLRGHLTATLALES